ncbi:GntR family carbon starvation induced transcriptional regulator [Amorphus suaedae]
MADTAQAPFPVHDAGQPAPMTRTAEAYARLRQDILSNAFAPGQRITIQFLQKRYEIGPTPLREALARLAADGFVIGEDNRGFRVPPMSLARLRDITDQRKLIEAQALRLSIARGGKAFDGALRDAYAKMTELDAGRSRGEEGAYIAWENQHRLFHAALIAGSGSEWLIRFQGILFDQADRYRRLYSDGRRINPEIQRDHERILEATLDKDAEMAALLLERHIERVYATAKRSGRLPET